MKQQEFLDLKKGDRVTFVSGVDSLLEAGDVLVRTPSWLDDGKTHKFMKDGCTTHFLSADNISL